jgi:hypothetical protein
MSVFTTIKKQKQAKIPNSKYIKTENKPDDAGTKPTEPTTSPQPEAK